MSEIGTDSYLVGSTEAFQEQCNQSSKPSSENISFAYLTEENRDRFFSFNSKPFLDCHIFLVRESSVNEFLQSMNGDSLYHDSYFINSKTILAVLYRKFLCNEVSILSNNKALSRCIEKYALEMDVPIVCKHISNVLEVGY